MLIKSSSLKLLACLCLCLSFCINARAQSEKINLHFISFPKVANPEPLHLLIGENETLEVQMPTNQISEAYQVPSLPNWVLGKASSPEEDQFSFDTYGKTPSLRSKNQLVLVLRSEKNEPGNLELITFDFSENAFGGGEYLFMNATKVDIAGVIGDVKFAIKPKTSEIIAPKPTKKQGDRNYSYARFFFRNKDTAKGFFSATWRLNEKIRSMVFFYHDPGTGQIRLHIVRSFLSNN